MSDSKPTKSFGGAIAATLIGLVLMIVAAEILLRFFLPNWQEFYSGRFMGFVEVPGHGYLRLGKPKFDGYFAQNNGDFRIKIRINGSGLRNAEPLSASDGQIWVIGDSMTFGWGVERRETYSELIEVSQKFAAYNLAAPGNDVCAYQLMSYMPPRDFEPKAVVVGLVMENDVMKYDCEAENKKKLSAVKPTSLSGSLKSLSEAKKLATEVSSLYNFLAVTLKRVGVVNELLIRSGILKKEHAYRANPEKSDRPQIAIDTARELNVLRARFAKSIPFAVLIIPTRSEIKSGDADSRDMRLKTIDELKARGLNVIDPLEAFKDRGFEKTHFPHDGHWNPAGHQIAADHVVRWLNTTFE